MMVTLARRAAGVIVHHQADMLEEGAEGFIFLHRARELGEVFEAAGGFGAALGLEHRRCSRFRRAGCRASSGWGSSLAIVPPAGDVGDEAAEAAARLRGQFVAVEHLRGGEQQRLLGGAGEGVDVARPPCRRGRAWAVDDPLEGEVVGRLGDQAEVGERIADLGALVEAEAADDLVGEADGDEALLELAGLELGADEDRGIVERAAAALVRLDLLADAARFLGAVPHADDLDPVALVDLGPQRLAEAAGVVGDEAGGGGEDVRGRAVILFEPDDRRRRGNPSRSAGCWRPRRRATNRSTGRRRRRSTGCGAARRAASATHTAPALVS